MDIIHVIAQDTLLILYKVIEWTHFLMCESFQPKRKENDREIKDTCTNTRIRLRDSTEQRLGAPIGGLECRGPNPGSASHRQGDMRDQERHSLSQRLRFLICTSITWVLSRWNKLITYIKCLERAWWLTDAAISGSYYIRLFLTKKLTSWNMISADLDNLLNVHEFYKTYMKCKIRNRYIYKIMASKILTVPDSR